MNQSEEGIRTSASGRIKKIDIPPEEALKQLLEKIQELSDMRFTAASSANARLLTINKATKNCLLLLRSLSETNEFSVQEIQLSLED